VSGFVLNAFIDRTLAWPHSSLHTRKIRRFYTELSVLHFS
jgi:hypothetical protein